MVYDIKKHLIEEGVLEHVKNNIGKYGLAAAGLAAGGAGEFGDAAEGAIKSGANAISSIGSGAASMGHRVIDNYSGHNTTPSALPNSAGNVPGPDAGHDEKVDAAKTAAAKTVAAKTAAATGLNTADHDANFLKSKPADIASKGIFTNTNTTHSASIDPETGARKWVANDPETNLNLVGKLTAGTAGLAGTYMGGRAIFNRSATGKRRAAERDIGQAAILKSRMA